MAPFGEVGDTLGGGASLGEAGYWVPASSSPGLFVEHEANRPLFRHTLLPPGWFFVRGQTNKKQALRNHEAKSNLSFFKVFSQGSGSGDTQ